MSALFRRSSVGISGLPADDPTGVDLNLLGQGKNRAIFLKNPLGCKKSLNFVARPLPSKKTIDDFTATPGAEPPMPQWLKR